VAKWSDTEIFEALSWYARERGVTVFTDVPVTGPDVGDWGADCLTRLDTVVIPAVDRGAVRPFEERAFGAAMSGASQVHLVMAWGYADRPGFGHLATRKAFLERSWRPAAPVQPLALVAPGQDRPNVAPTYNAAGFDILAVAGEAPQKRSGGGGPPANNDPWDAPRWPEDRCLHDLWTARGRSGWRLAEVPIGAGAARRLDAVVIARSADRTSKARADLGDFRAAVAGGIDVELVEAKEALNVSAIGQLLCGAHMFSEEYAGQGELSLTACVRRPGDEALDWFCAERGIRVEVVAEDAPELPPL
jgi:hypothetical protein